MKLLLTRGDAGAGTERVDFFELIWVRISAKEAVRCGKGGGDVKVIGWFQFGAKPKRTVVPAGTLTTSFSLATLVHCWVAGEAPVVMPAPVPSASTSLNLIWVQDLRQRSCLLR